MKFLVMNLLHNIPNIVTGETVSEQELFQQVLAQAQLVEQLGFDAYGIGERHGAPFISSSPAIVLTAIAAITSKIRIFPTLSVLSFLDPLRVAEDYATLDHLSQGRLQLMIGKGNDPRHFDLFNVKEEQQWEALAEKYDLLTRLWSEENVTWSGKFRTPIKNVTAEPRPYQKKISIWHGSASSKISTDLAAKNNDPLFSSNGFHELSKYTELVDHYRERLEYYGHDPKNAVIGTAAGALYIADTTEKAIEEYRPYYDAVMQTDAFKHNQSTFKSIEDHIENGSLLVGSPEKIIQRIVQFHEAFGHQIQAISVANLPFALQTEQLQRFATEILPVLKEKLPNSLWETNDVLTV